MGTYNITAKFEAGALLRKEIRQFLQTQQFRGYKFEWIEQKGFLSSTFRLKGEETLIRQMVEAIQAVCE